MKTLQLLFIILIVLGNVHTKAQKQTYDEPQWKLRLFFEDATGAKDTLTIGYDPSASIYLSYYEPHFGEVWKKIDTTKFNVYTRQKWGYEHPVLPPINTDTVMKTSVTSWHRPYAEFGWVHGQLPITMTWETPQLDSPDLPSNFPDLATYPRARIDFWIDWWIDWPILECEEVIASDPNPPTVILASDISYPHWCMAGCMFTDQLIFDSVFHEEIGYTMSVPYIYIAPYEDAYWCDLSISDFEIKKLNCYPNPVIDILFIKRIDGVNIQKITIYDVMGNLLFTSTYFQKQIDLTHFKNGFYLLKIDTDKGVIIKKIIKK